MNIRDYDSPGRSSDAITVMPRDKYNVEAYFGIEIEN